MTLSSFLPPQALKGAHGPSWEVGLYLHVCIHVCMGVWVIHMHVHVVA